jgi:ubiquinone biosynthesis protein
LGWLVQALGLAACVSLRCRLVCAFRPASKCPHHVAADVPLPERLRLTLERLGPTFVKAGQMLALRPDYVPLEYAEALRGLHTHAAPFPAAEAVAIVEAELRAPLGTLYAEFDPVTADAQPPVGHPGYYQPITLFALSAWGWRRRE